MYVYVFMYVYTYELNLPLKHSNDGFDDTFNDGEMHKPKIVSNKYDTIFSFLLRILIFILFLSKQFRTT